jgi:hypothetical protein
LACAARDLVLNSGNEQILVTQLVVKICAWDRPFVGIPSDYQESSLARAYDSFTKFSELLFVTFGFLLQLLSPPAESVEVANHSGEVWKWASTSVWPSRSLAALGVFSLVETVC